MLFSLLLILLTLVLNQGNRQLTSGYDHNCQIDLTSKLVCWGRSEYSRLSIPKFLFMEQYYSQVSAGFAHTCALDINQNILCFGWNRYNQLDRPRMKASNVSAGFAHSCAIIKSSSPTGRLLCWGCNWSDQIEPPAKFIAYTLEVGTGQGHSCAIDFDDNLQCWGYNINGQILVPVITNEKGEESNESGDGYWEEVHPGSNHTCGLLIDNTIVCWGWNKQGQSDVPQNQGLSIQKVNGQNVSNMKAQNMAAGFVHTCAVNDSGFVWCWGRNSFGESEVPVGLQTSNQVLSAGHQHTCAAVIEGGIQCWGSNQQKQLDVPDGLV